MAAHDQLEIVLVQSIREGKLYDIYYFCELCNIRAYAPRELAEHLAGHGIFAWDGNYYALGIMERLGLEERGGALRLGMAHYNTPEEIDRVLDALERLPTH